MIRSKNRNLYLGIGVVIVLAIIFCLLLLNSTMYPKWEGISSDGNWKIVYSKTGSGDYEGEAYWQGSKKDVHNTYLVFSQLRVNGKYYAGSKKEIGSKKEEIITNPDNTSLAAFVSKGDLNHKNVVQYLYWKQDNQSKHKEKVHLKKKTLFGLVTAK